MRVRIIFTEKIKKLVFFLRSYGLGFVCFKLKRKYITWRENRSTGRMLKKSEAENAAAGFDMGRVSILVPLYNTPDRFLTEMIDSVKAQTYANWELCLADGSDEAHHGVGDTAKSYAAKDPRIVYKHLCKNEGISENTNRCMEMASGDYIAFCDHDDVLSVHAIEESLRVLKETDADMTYSDEVVFVGDRFSVVSTHKKPDFCIDNLRANNYFCHFTLMRRELMEKTGKFRPELDGSQDFDYMLRASENARRIGHVRRYLYFWRSHKNSLAAGMFAKPYAALAAKRAVTEHLIRMGIGAQAEPTEVFPAIIHVDYALTETPKVSIIVQGDPASVKRAAISAAQSDYADTEIVAPKSLGAGLCDVKSVVLADGDDMDSLVAAAGGSMLVFISGAVSDAGTDWLRQLLMYCQREDVGAVGGKLVTKKGRISAAGLAIDQEKGVLRLHYSYPVQDTGYMGKLWYAHEVSAVTSGCMMVKKELFIAAGGFSKELSGDARDADLCLKIRELNKKIILNPYAQLTADEKPAKCTDAQCVKLKNSHSAFYQRGELYER